MVVDGYGAKYQGHRASRMARDDQNERREDAGALRRRAFINDSFLADVGATHKVTEGTEARREGQVTDGID